ncbi:tandem-95 repeat protein, partial [Candidatus Woesearchaeota archaeon]|nr:tandem-95 repeat protein [Candidatus Woesearchaeota archaeon]
MEQQKQQQRIPYVLLSLVITLAFAFLIPSVFAASNFMDSFWTTGDDAENLSLNQGENAGLYVHVPFVPVGGSFTFAVSGENDEISQYLVRPSTRTAPDSRTIPISTASLAGEYEIIVQAVNAGGTDVETLQLNVNTVPQIIVPASPIVVEDGQLVTFNVIGTDADKDALTLGFARRPPTGAVLTSRSSVAGRIEKEFRWTPAYTKVGTYILTFIVEDEDGFEDTATVTIIVNPHNTAPVVTGFGNDFGGTLDENNSILEGETLIAQVNAFDADGDLLHYEVERKVCLRLLGCAYYGSLLLEEMSFNEETGIFVFSPGFDFVTHPDLEKTVYLRFRVFDGEFYSAWEEMTTRVLDVNQRPVTEPATFTLQEDEEITFILPAHDDDEEDELTYEIGGRRPLQGRLSNLDIQTGSITYTPNANYFGRDEFTFFVVDDAGRGGDSISGQGLIRLEIVAVNDAPVFDVPNFTWGEDFPLQMINLHTYTSDIDTASNAMVYRIISQSNPSLMNCAFNTATPFRLECTSQANQYGVNTITLSVSDGENIITDSFTITVNPLNDPVTLTGQVPLSTPEDTPLALTLANLIVDDPDNEFPVGFSLTIAGGLNYTVSGATETTITPALNFNGVLSVPATLLQGGMVRGEIVLRIDVTPVNDAPVARDDTVTVTEDILELIDVLENDGDVEGDAIFIDVVEAPIYGTATIETTASGGVIKYTPRANDTSDDTFRYAIRDAFGRLSRIATVYVSIEQINDIPQLNFVIQTIQEDSGAHSYNLRDYASDVEDIPEELSFFISGESGNDIIDCEIVGDGFTLVCTTQTNQNGENVVDIRVNDSEGAFRFFPVKFIVTPVNDAPVARDDAVEVTEDVAQVISVLANDSDIDSVLDVGSVDIVRAPEYGATVVHADGTVTYTPDVNSLTADNFSYTVKD